MNEVECKRLRVEDRDVNCACQLEAAHGLTREKPESIGHVAREDSAET